MMSPAAALHVHRIKRLKEGNALLGADELKKKAQALRGQAPEKACDLLFALISIAVERTLGLTPFDEQLRGALAMSRGEVAQMQTGQGKTLTAVFPAMLYALTGPSLIATVNPYLARRDCEWMRPVYEYLGFTAGVTLPKMSLEDKHKSYACDVVYGTHSEFGFDYLRDRMAQRQEDRVQTRPNFMLVDEADSILLDEAVTPMILSAAGGDLDELLLAADRFVSWLRPATVQALDDEDEYARLDREVDYIVILRDRVAILTQLGQQHAEQFFRIPDLTGDLRILHLVYQALQAHGTLKRDRDYIVKDGKLQIVDPHTGRVLDGRRYCNGLWQALEVKERLDVVKESRTVASISYQQFFRRYPHLCGMTGTAWEGRREFAKVYGMPTRRIPPHQKNRRRQLMDSISPDRDAQIRSLAQEVQGAAGRGQPCLAVTRSVEDSEDLARALQALGMECEVLNAKEDAREAEIIARAGQHGKVTVATALAGRGTDIVLDERARAAGGLYVLGLGHQNTRRGDRQLMGRSGRQGDPGLCRFFVSPEDELIVRYEEKAPCGRSCLQAVKRAQKACEVIAQSQRETTLKLDSVIGRFREELYSLRDRVLEGEIPERYQAYPKEIVQPLILAAIDQAWAVYLLEIEDARDRIGVVSLTGRNYEVEYTKEVAGMFEAMLSDIEETIEATLARLEGKTLHVERL